MKERIKGFWRTFIHNINYKDGYFKKVAIILLTLLLIDLVVLYIVW